MPKTKRKVIEITPELQKEIEELLARTEEIEKRATIAIAKTEEALRWFRILTRTR